MQSATIHNLRDCEFDEAETREAVQARFLEVAAGKVLVFHDVALATAELLIAMASHRSGGQSFPLGQLL